MSRKNYLPCDEAREILEANGYTIESAGNWYKTNCPAHEDDTPSLGFRAGKDDGNFVPHCLAGCKVRHIVQAIRRLDGQSVGFSTGRARRMQEYLTAKDDWTDAELAHLFKVCDRTIRRWIAAWAQDGLRWKRGAHGKVYDISEWRDRTSEADSDSDRTQSKSTGADLADDGEDGSSAAGSSGGTNHLTTTSPRGLHSDNRAQNVRSLAGPIVDYDYLDPRTGGLVAIKRRHIAAKEFRWHRPRREKHLRTAGIAHTLKPMTEADLPLYNAHRLGKYPLDRYVFVVEGEKAVNALTELGFMAVCFPGGATARDFREEVWKDLVNRRVILWPDSDEPGRGLMWYIGQLLDGWVPVKWWVEPPGLASGGDAYDYIEANRTPGVPLLDDGAYEAVLDLIPVNPTVNPGRYMTHACGLYTKHIGGSCPSSRCGSRGWESPVDDEEWEKQARGASVLWEQHVRMEVRLFGCLDGCTHTSHNDEQPSRVKKGSKWVEGPSVKEFIATLKQEAAITP